MLTSSVTWAYGLDGSPVVTLSVRTSCLSQPLPEMIKALNTLAMANGISNGQVTGMSWRRKNRRTNNAHELVLLVFLSTACFGSEGEEIPMAAFRIDWQLGRQSTGQAYRVLWSDPQ